MATTTTLSLFHGGSNWMDLVSEAFADPAPDYVSSSEVVFTSFAGSKLHVFGTGFSGPDLAGGEINGFTVYLDGAAETAGDPFATATGFNLLVDTTPGLATAIAAHDGAGVFAFLLSQSIDPGTGSTEADQFAASGFGDVIDGGKGFDVIDYGAVDARFNDGQHEGIRVDLGAGGHAAVDHLDTSGDPGLYADDLVGVEEIIGTENADKFHGNSGYDVDKGVIGFVGGAGGDLFLGDSGVLAVGYDVEEFLGHPTAAVGVKVDLAAGTATDTFGDADSFTIVPMATFLIHGTTLADEFTSGAADGRFDGGEGNDVFTVGATAVAGKVVFVGGDGADSYVGDPTHPEHAVRVDYGLENDGAPASGVTVNLSVAGAFGMSPMSALDSFGNIDTYHGLGSFEVRGTDHADTFIVGEDIEGASFGGGGGDHFILNSVGAVTCVGGSGNDYVEGNDFYPAQRVIIDYGAEGGGSSVAVNLAAGSATDTFGDTDQFTAVRSFRIVGTAGADTVVGNDFGGEFWSGAGDDILAGGTGNDTFRPGTADSVDTIDGGGGFDLIHLADQGVDHAHIHLGSDNGAGSVVMLDASDAEIGKTVFQNVEGIVGTGGSDFFNADADVGAADGSLFEWTGGNGADHFNNVDGARILLDYDREKYEHGFDFGELWGDAAGELGVKVNLSTVSGFSSSTDFGITIDFDGSGATDQVIAAGRAVDTFGAVDTLDTILHVRGTDALDVLVAAETGSFLDGRAGGDYLFGRGGNDRFVGGDGNDYIDGAGGADDTVDYSGEGGGSAVTVDLAAASAVDTFGAHDTLIRVEGVIGTADRDSLFGDGNANRLEGGGQDDVLDGRGGGDLLVGGLGGDTYFVDDAADVVDEAGGNGTDLVRASITFNLSDTLHVHGDVEQLVLTGAADIDATGNGLDNGLVGNAGANRLAGLAGADIMVGGDGNDVYVVGEGGDVVDETGTAGTDTVRSSISFNLADAAHAKGAIENLALVGGGATSGRGNGLANAIVGGSGRNTLDGGRGNDVLTGKAGADKFLFDSQLNAKFNRDHVTDFRHGADHIVLDDDVFRKVGHKITADSFHLGTAAGDAADRLIYDRMHGRLYYDSDGTGGHAKVLFAILDNHAALTAGDFVVVA